MDRAAGTVGQCRLLAVRFGNFPLELGIARAVTRVVGVECQRLRVGAVRGDELIVHLFGLPEVKKGRRPTGD